jgi:hypothetical protein
LIPAQIEVFQLGSYIIHEKSLLNSMVVTFDDLNLPDSNFGGILNLLSFSQRNSKSVNEDNDSSGTAPTKPTPARLMAVIDPFLQVMYWSPYGGTRKHEHGSLLLLHAVHKVPPVWSNNSPNAAH